MLEHKYICVISGRMRVSHWRFKETINRCGELIDKVIDNSTRHEIHLKDGRVLYFVSEKEYEILAVGRHDLWELDGDYYEKMLDHYITDSEATKRTAREIVKIILEEEWEYIVGDTLEKVAKRYGLDYEAIRKEVEDS